MSTALDLAALAAQGELKIPIARGVVSQGGSGTDYTGWSGVSSVFVEAKVEVREQSRGFATLTLTVEGSTNGSDWSTLETFTFGAGGSQSATVSAPDDHLRVSWAVGGGSEWQIIEVTAAPSIIDTGGGSQPLHGWHAYWDAFPGSWTITAELGWNTNTYEPTAVDFDTDGFADAGSLPFFAPKIPVGLGGLYKGLLTAQYIQGATGGYVSGNIGSGIGFNAAPCLFDDGTAMIYSLGDVAVLNDGANDWDIANVLNFSAHDVMILRVDFWGVRLGPLPT